MKKHSQVKILRKRIFWATNGSQPMTFQILVGCSNHWDTGDSRWARSYTRFRTLLHYLHFIQVNNPFINNWSCKVSTSHDHEWCHDFASQVSVIQSEYSELGANNGITLKEIYISHYIKRIKSRTGLLYRWIMLSTRAWFVFLTQLSTG